MILTETPLAGAFVVDVERRSDERGFFARSYCQREFAAHGVELPVAQCNVSFNALRGTLRGMHYQVEPRAERKLVRCTQGAVFDVIIDVRPASPTYCHWFAAELSSENHRALYIPEGFAHGFQSLAENTELCYLMSEFYSPEHARGVRWNDPAFGVEWPLAAVAVSEKDQSYCDFIRTA